MEIVEIAKDRLKVVLDSDELREFAIDLAGMEYDNEQTERMLEGVLAVVGAKTDFASKKGKTYVQLYPSRQGGCEIFVTKIGSIYKDEEDEELFDTSRASLTEIPIKRKRKKNNDKAKSLFVLSFSTLSDMLLLCRALQSRGYAEESRAYISEDSRFYLVLETQAECDFPYSEIYPFVLEFGEEESPASTERFLLEHARMICKAGAVATLSEC